MWGIVSCEYSYLACWVLCFCISCKVWTDLASRDELCGFFFCKKLIIFPSKGASSCLGNIHGAASYINKTVLQAELLADQTLEAYLAADKLSKQQRVFLIYDFATIVQFIQFASRVQFVRCTTTVCILYNNSTSSTIL